MTLTNRSASERRTNKPALQFKKQTEQPVCDKLIPRTDEALTFLKEFHPNGPWHLVAIKETRIQGETFHSLEVMRRWIDERQGNANIYFQVNPLRQKPSRSKATKADVAAGISLHVDVDLPGGDALSSIRSYRPAPTAIIHSGGGYQAFWFLNKPTNDLELLEHHNKAIAKQLGGDNCHNCDRIMRLPGTINILNAKKIARGRTPALAHVIEIDGGRRYSLDTFKSSDSLVVKSPNSTTREQLRPVSINDLPQALDAALITSI